MIKGVDPNQENNQLFIKSDIENKKKLFCRKLQYFLRDRLLIKKNNWTIKTLDLVLEID